MKTNFLLLFFCLSTTMLFFSCSSKTIKIEEKVFTEKRYLSSDTTKGSISIDLLIDLPVDYKNKEVLDTIRKKLISNLFGENFVNLPNDSIVEVFKSYVIDDYITNNKPLLDKMDKSSKYSFINVYNLSGFSLLSDKHIFVYAIEKNIFTGGAHGIETKNYYNFDLKTGKLITEVDLFIPNFKDSLTQLIKKRIVSESTENNDKQPIFNLDESEYWTDSIKPNSNFYITDLGLKYVFNPYEIAPFSMGETEIFLSFNSIKNILKPENPISYLIDKTEK